MANAVARCSGRWWDTFGLSTQVPWQVASACERGPQRLLHAIFLDMRCWPKPWASTGTDPLRPECNNLEWAHLRYMASSICGSSGRSWKRFIQNIVLRERRQISATTVTRTLGDPPTHTCPWADVYCTCYSQVFADNPCMSLLFWNSKKVISKHLSSFIVVFLLVVTDNAKEFFNRAKASMEEICPGYWAPMLRKAKYKNLFVSHDYPTAGALLREIMLTVHERSLPRPATICTSTGSNPTYGRSTLRWMQIAYGHLCFIRVAYGRRADGAAGYEIFGAKPSLQQLLLARRLLWEITYST